MKPLYVLRHKCQYCKVANLYLLVVLIKRQSSLHHKKQNRCKGVTNFSIVFYNVDTELAVNSLNKLMWISLSVNFFGLGKGCLQKFRQYPYRNNFGMRDFVLIFLMSVFVFLIKLSSCNRYQEIIRFLHCKKIQMVEKGILKL